MPDQRGPNERFGLLIGWTYNREHGWYVDPVTGVGRMPMPQIATWENLPQMQEYVRGLDPVTRQQVMVAIFPRIEGLDGVGLLDAITKITPTILRDAILVVMDA